MPPEPSASTEPLIPARKERNWTGIFLSIASGTLLTCGCAYLAGYWRYYRINFLDYISINEVIARSIFDVVPIILITLEIGLFMLLLGENRKLQSLGQRHRAKWRPDDWRLHPLVGRFTLPAISMVGAVAMFIIFRWDNGDPITAWVMTMPCLCGLLASLLGPIFFPKLGVEDSWILAVILAAIPVSCYMRGSLYAMDRVTATTAQEMEYVIRLDPDLEASRQTILPEYIYAGRMGGFVFLISKKHQSTMVIPESRVQFLDVFKRKPKEVQAPAVPPPR